MKKLVVLLMSIVAVCILLSLTVFAAYNYGAPPTPSVAGWNFEGSRAYTIDGWVDILYEEGQDRLIFSDIMSSATTNVKVKSNYYSHGDVGIRGSDGVYKYTHNCLPEHSGYSYITTIKSNSYKPASFVRYDAKYYQMSGNNLINTTNVHYNSDDRVIRYW